MQRTLTGCYDLQSHSHGQDPNHYKTAERIAISLICILRMFYEGDLWYMSSFKPLYGLSFFCRHLLYLFQKPFQPTSALLMSSTKTKSPSRPPTLGLLRCNCLSRIGPTMDESQFCRGRMLPLCTQDHITYSETEPPNHSKSRHMRSRNRKQRTLLCILHVVSVLPSWQTIWGIMRRETEHHMPLMGDPISKRRIQTKRK